MQPMVDLAMVRVQQGDRSFTCHPHAYLNSPAERHHPLAGTHCIYPQMHGQAELTWVAGCMPRILQRWWNEFWW